MAFEHFDGWLYAEPFLAVVPCLLRSFLLPPPSWKAVSSTPPRALFAVP